MLKSETKITFSDKNEVITQLEKTLKECKKENNTISQVNFFHTTNIDLTENSANIKVTFSKLFYIFYVIAGIITTLLPFENAFVGSSALAVFIIFSTVMYFSLDYKLKNILDGFN